MAFDVANPHFCFLLVTLLLSYKTVTHARVNKMKLLVHASFVILLVAIIVDTVASYDTKSELERTRQPQRFA